MHTKFSDHVNSSGDRTPTVEGLARHDDVRYLFYDISHPKFSLINRHDTRQVASFRVDSTQPNSDCIFLLLSSEYALNEGSLWGRLGRVFFAFIPSLCSHDYFSSNCLRSEKKATCRVSSLFTRETFAWLLRYQRSKGES